MVRYDTVYPFNPYTHRGSLHWCEFGPFLRRNRNYNAQIKINFYPKIFNDIVTVMDWHLPEMALRTGQWRPWAGETRGQASTVEYEAHAVVCNVGWLGGECPMENLPGLLKKDEWGQDTTAVLRKPVRGVKEAVRMALHMLVLRPTLEVGLLLDDPAIISAASRRLRA